MEGIDLEEFEDLFGGDIRPLSRRAAQADRAGGRRRAPAEPTRGQDAQGEIGLTMSEAYHGTKKDISLQVQEVCPECGGTGRKGRRTCPTCQGAGSLLRTRQITVKVPAGVKEGSRIRLAGQGSPGVMGAPAGDLFITVRLQPHPVFTLKGEDLHVNLPVTPWEVAPGGQGRGAHADGGRRDDRSRRQQGRPDAAAARAVAGPARRGAWRSVRPPGGDGAAATNDAQRQAYEQLAKSADIDVRQDLKGQASL